MDGKVRNRCKCLGTVQKTKTGDDILKTTGIRERKKKRKKKVGWR